MKKKYLILLNFNVLDVPTQTAATQTLPGEISAIYVRVLNQKEPKVVGLAVEAEEEAAVVAVVATGK